MNREPRKIVPRVCAACPADLGIEGPLPWSADVHLVNGEMVVSCSPTCRRRLSLPERKVSE